MALDDSQRVFLSSKRPATSHCFDYAKRSLLAAELEINRVWVERQLSSDLAEKALVYQYILIDLHFYFISLRNIYRYLEKIVVDPTYVHLKPKLEDLNSKWFKHYSKTREAFEHIDQRLSGERHESKMAEIEEGGAKRKIHYGLYMRKAIFAHSDLEWDISIRKFGELKCDVDSFFDEVLIASNVEAPT